MTPTLSIAVSAVAIALAAFNLAFIFNRPHIKRGAVNVGLSALTILISSGSITVSLAKMGEPQSCWLVAEIMGVVIDACHP